MSKKALVLVQGISNKVYIQQDVESVKSAFKNYDKIKVAPTEGIFDKSIVSKLSDRFGDVVQYFKSHKQRKDACAKVRRTIESLQEEGYEVDVLAHSLGTLMTLTSGRSVELDKSTSVNKVFLFACPLGMVWPMGFYARNHTRKFIQNFKAKEIVYCYSPRDFVSKKWGKSIKDILLLASNNIKSIELDCSHSLKEYLADMFQ